MHIMVTCGAHYGNAWLQNGVTLMAVPLRRIMAIWGAILDFAGMKYDMMNDLHDFRRGTLYRDETTLNYG